MKKNFRFYDNRQKYLLFVTTTNEKNQIADAIRPHVNKIKPQKPGIKIFDAGMGDGSLLMNVMRQCHEAEPNVPLLVCTKEISIEDVRLGLEKLPDRFVEHKNTVFVISNLHYAEAANLKSKNEVKQKKINWNIIKLKGDTSLEFAQQLRKQNEFLEKKWNIEINKKSGNHTYKEPSVMVIYREDQEFNANELIPTKKKSDNKFDLIIASQPYRSRITAEKKSKYVIEPMIRALKSKGKLLTIHASGKDPANEIIRKIWPKEDPFPSLGNSIISYLKKNLDKDLLSSLSFGEKRIIKCKLRALPTEISGGIATSLVFSAWNASIYVNQMDDDKVMRVEKTRNYEKVVQKIVSKNKGLYFNNEIFVIEKK